MFLLGRHYGMQNPGATGTTGKAECWLMDTDPTTLGLSRSSSSSCSSERDSLSNQLGSSSYLAVYTIPAWATSNAVLIHRYESQPLGRTHTLYLFDAGWWRGVCMDVFLVPYAERPCVLVTMPGNRCRAMHKVLGKGVDASLRTPFLPRTLSKTVTASAPAPVGECAQ